ncbi:5-methylcytosine rRNA methyltransferase NSUN4 [Onthophagus taurus]|uniref:5-methylcytosine rRNA methyltransferase NSUN4 n=1 Tax=Onthophagus taurus TaxID=166361 RepID=UPI0039BE2B28
MLFLSFSRQIPLHILKRFKHKDSHWSVARKKKSHTQRALEHFNEFYEPIYKTDWGGIRQGLLTRQKYVALINNFSDSERICNELERTGAMNLRRLFHLEKEYLSINNKKLNQSIKTLKNTNNESINEDQIEKIDSNRIIDGVNSNLSLTEFVPATKIKGMEDFITESEHYNSYNPQDSSIVEIEKQYDFNFPNTLNVYIYDTMDKQTFKSPRKGSTGVLDYYLLDGGSLLPILALDIQPNEKILDMCSSPGGKSLIILQTLYPKTLICNDISKSRIDRIFKVMKEYLYDLNENWFETGRLKIQNMDGRDINDEFDRVLVDVPCTTDRHSVNQEDNNIFKPDRIKERLKLPELQSDLLVNALKMVRVNGTVVYSTCTLSPIQNDGVVHMALKRICEETDLGFKIIDMRPALMQVLTSYKMFGSSWKYGHLVVPNLSRNFGPTYFCKLERTR